MPISSERMARYPGGSTRSPEWQAIRERIGKRSGWKCETCGVAHGAMICRGAHDDAGTYITEAGDVFDAETGAALGGVQIADYQCSRKWTKIVLTVAHVNQDETDNRDENLLHLCQMHHNRLDAPHRRKNAAETRVRKVGQGDMFGGPA